MKYFLIVISILLTACASTMPPMTASECAEQHRRLVEQQNQLKLRKAVVQKQLTMLVPSEVKYAMLPRTALVNDFNIQVDNLEAQIHLHNSRCVLKK